jgi:ATP-dependent Lon protease
MDRLEQMHPDAAEASMVGPILTGWWKCLVKIDVDNLDLRKAKKVLDEDHYDLEKVKDRILEYRASTN